MIQIKSKSEQDRPFNLLAWGHWFAFGNLIMALVFSSVYLINSNNPDSLLGWVYLLTSWIGHFAFLCLAGFVLSIFPFITLFPYKRHIRGLAAVIASLLQMLLFLDLLTYLGLGYHLDAVSINQLREVEDVYISLLGDGYWYLLLAVFALIITYQITISNLTWKRITQLQSLSFKNTLARTLLTCFVLSHVIHLWADATLNADVAKQSNLYPLSYPLTAKTLLAKYDVIDLEEYQQNRSQFALVSNKTYISKPVVEHSCALDSKQNLHVTFLPEQHVTAVQNWLSKNHVKHSYNTHLYMSTDLDAITYAFQTGLPSYYQGLQGGKDKQLNAHIGNSAIELTFVSGAFDEQQAIQNPSDSKVFVFLPDTKEEFARAKVILVGFEVEKELNISPQTIVATYIAEKLNCPSYVENNLIDSPLSEVDNNYIHVNFSNDSLGILYKDKSMIFSQGQLLSIKTFSSGQAVEEALDLSTIQQAVQKLTLQRQEAKTSGRVKGLF